MTQWFSDEFIKTREGKAAEHLFFECYPVPYVDQSPEEWKGVRKDEKEIPDTRTGKFKTVKLSPLKYRLYDAFREAWLNRFDFAANPLTEPEAFRRQLKDDLDGKAFDIHFLRDLPERPPVSEVYNQKEWEKEEELRSLNPPPMLSFMIVLKWLCPCMRK